jgi:serine protease Do
MKTITKIASVMIVAGLAGGLAGGIHATAQAAQTTKTTGKATVTINDTPITRDAKTGTSYATVVKKAAPSVVYIYTSKTVKQGFNFEMHPFFNDEMFRRFFGDRFSSPGRAPREFKQRGLGSGVIITKDGYILTNNHVVDGADEVKVMLANEKKEHVAKIVGRDPKTDVAVLKIEGESFPFVTFGDSDQLEVGDVVLAVGNPFGVGQTVTMGIVSATGRNNIGIEDYEDFIQTDAAINPGNSGGALVDIEGRLVGINTAILSPSGGNMGVGFAVPVSLARSIMERLLQDGKVVRGYLGVSIQDVTPDLAKEFKVPETGGALVGGVTDDSAAAEAGTKSGDIIIDINGKPVKDSRTLRLTVSSIAPGTKIDVKVLRDGKERSFKVTLREMPANLESASVSPEVGNEDALDGVVVSDLDSKARNQLKLPSDLKGAVITSIDNSSAAYEVGLREGDVILEINRKTVSNAEEAVQATKGLKNKRVLVRVWSNGGSRYLVVDETKKK